MNLTAIAVIVIALAWGASLWLWGRARYRAGYTSGSDAERARRDENNNEYLRKVGSMPDSIDNDFIVRDRKAWDATVQTNTREWMERANAEYAKRGGA